MELSKVRGLARLGSGCLVVAVRRRRLVRSLCLRQVEKRRRSHATAPARVLHAWRRMRHGRKGPCFWSQKIVRAYALTLCSLPTR